VSDLAEAGHVWSVQQFATGEHDLPGCVVLVPCFPRC